MVVVVEGGGVGHSVVDTMTVVSLERLPAASRASTASV
jgi:hypothetical protein